MSKIDLHNYEAFYLDYIEGNLDAEEIAELLLFLENNSALKSELEDVELITLDTAPAEKADFSELKQQISATNAEDFIIGSLEGELNKEDEKELAALIAIDIHVEKLANRYKKTILPKTLIEFPYKAKLKRKAGIVLFMTPMRRVAAVAILLLALIPFFNEEEAIQVADNEKLKKESTIDSIPEIEISDDTLRFNKKISKEVQRTSEPNLVVAASSPKSIELDNSTSPERVSMKKLNRKSVNNIHVDFSNDEIAELKPDNSSIEKTPTIPATVAEPLLAQSDEPLSIGEWLNQNIRKRIFKEEQPTDEKIQGTELLVGASNVIQEKTNSTLAFTQSSNQKNATYTVIIGKFSISRTKSN